MDIRFAEPNFNNIPSDIQVKIMNINKEKQKKEFLIQKEKKKKVLEVIKSNLEYCREFREEIDFEENLIILFILDFRTCNINGDFIYTT